MPRFLFEASYTVDGVKGLRRQGGTVDVKPWPGQPKVSVDALSTSTSPSVTMTPSPSPIFRTTRVPPLLLSPSARQGVRAYGQWCS